DGIVYAAMVGIGFAFTENILYLAAAYNGTDGAGPGGTEALTATFVVRCLFSPFAHPLFTAFTGIGVGLAVSARSHLARILWPLGGYACAVLAHAVWNTSTVYGFDNFVIAYVVLMAPAFVALAGLAVWVRSSERRVLAAALSDAARRGLVPATDIGWVVDLGARRRSRAYARQVGGRPAERVMRDYQQAAIELGFLHYRFLRGTPPPDYAARGQQFLQRIAALRPSIAFPGQVVPTR
ncbi:PrsW family intramembrane metalloprotease, partial [Nocardioides sp.]|uniref:PrsW family intramembrane metalloprotease n=1 Tax=Nocardioides sp. TaxID=35761 RepID=UPI0025F93561